MNYDPLAQAERLKPGFDLNKSVCPRCGQIGFHQCIAESPLDRIEQKKPISCKMLKTPALHVPMCQHSLVTQDSVNFRKRCPVEGLSATDCRNKACVRIGRKNYCKKHGGMIALDILLNQQDS